MLSQYLSTSYIKNHELIERRDGRKVKIIFLYYTCGDGMNGKRYSGCTFNQIGLVDAVYNMFDEDADDDNAIKKEL